MKKRKRFLWKGAVNVCYILCCWEKPVIASSFWGIGEKNPERHIFIKNLPSTTLMLSYRAAEALNHPRVCKLQPKPSCWTHRHISSAIKDIIYSMWPGIKTREEDFWDAHTVPLSSIRRKRDLLHQEMLEEGRTSVVVCRVHVSKETVGARGRGPAVGIWVGCIRAEGRFQKHPLFRESDFQRGFDSDAVCTISDNRGTKRMDVRGRALQRYSMYPKVKRQSERSAFSPVSVWP